MNVRCLFFVVAFTACKPTSINPGGDFDARSTADTGGADSVDVGSGTVDAALTDSSPVDAATTDAPMTVDVPATDVTPPVDMPVATDVASPGDVPDVTDQPAVADVPVVDVPVPADAGTCPAGMALIPAGTFTMGDGDASTLNAQPPHSVTLSAYCLDLTEVTVAAYGTCTAAGCTAPDTGTGCNWGVPGRSTHPVNCVTWNQARAYCQSRGGDLPTEAQWEYAARGADGRRYAWGDAVPGAQVCWSGTGVRASTCPVQSFSSGNSPFGLSDMAGNVWEWTRDWFASYAAAAAADPTGPESGTFRVNRGGGWGDSTASELRAALRYPGAPTNRFNNNGVRCARPPL